MSEPHRGAELPASEAEGWRDAYREIAEGGAGPGCLGDEAIASLVVGDAAPDDRARWASHVVRCSACAERYRLLGELHLEAGAGFDSARGGRSRIGWLAVAAALVALLGGGLFILLREPSTPADETVLRGEAVAIGPADQAVLQRPPAELEWSGAPSARDAISQRVRLFDASGGLVWETVDVDPETSRVPLPEQVARRLAPGSSYFWIVDLEDGTRPQLGPYWFRLAD
jgi:hypothetical protein